MPAGRLVRICSVCALAAAALSSAAGAGARGEAFTGGYAPTWSPDGRQLAYIGPPPRLDHVLVVAADGSGSRRVVASAGRGNSLDEVRWAAGGRFVYVAGADGRGVRRIA